MSRERIYTAIDVGTTKVCTIVGLVGLSGRVEVLSVDLQVSRGLRKGTVINLYETQAAVRASVQEAERQAGVRVRDAYVGVTGSHINCENITTSWQLGESNTPISVADLEKAIATCYTLPLEPTRKLLHVIPRSYTLDNQGGVRSPVGMHATRLDVETHLVTGALAPIENLVRAVEEVGVAVSGLVLEPLASAEAVLAPEEREMGIVLVDIGGGTSDMAVFRDGAIWYTWVLPVGGYQFTNDLSIGLSTPFANAEEVKVRYGHALAETVPEDEQLFVPRLGGSEQQKVSRRRVCQIIHERCEELLQIVAHRIQKTGLERPPPGGVVFTGGTAALPGLEALARRTVPGPVRLGIPRGLSGLSDRLESPQFATSVGILLWAVRHSQESQASHNGRSHLLQRFLTRLLGQVRKLVPA